MPNEIDLKIKYTKSQILQLLQIQELLLTFPSKNTPTYNLNYFELQYKNHLDLLTELEQQKQTELYNLIQINRTNNNKCLLT